MKTALLFDQGMVSCENHFDPFALTDVLTTFAGDNNQPIIHFWQLSQTLILGMKDSRVPHLAQGLKTIQEAGYYPLLRNSGGLGVVSDSGILNVSLILPKHTINNLSIDNGYQTMLNWLNRTIYGRTAKITAGEIPDSYCPGKFDLSIDRKKIAGIAQRRVKEGVAIMMYLSVSGDQLQRGELVRSFYQAGLDEMGTLGYPDVNPDSMTTISDVFAKRLTIDEVKLNLLEGIDFSNQTARLIEFYQTEEFQQRLKNMHKRNRSIQEGLHD